MSAELDPQNVLIDEWIENVKGLADNSKVETLVQGLVTSKVNLAYAMSRAQAAASICESSEQLPAGLYKAIQLLGDQRGSGTGLSVWQEYFAIIKSENSSKVNS